MIKPLQPLRSLAVMEVPNSADPSRDRRWPLDEFMPAVCPVDQVVITADMDYVRYDTKVLCSAYCAHRYRDANKGFVYIPERPNGPNGKR